MFKQYFGNKTILITGASYGIGESLTYLLAETGASLILVARTEERLHEVKAKAISLGASVSIFPANLRIHTEVDKLIQFLDNFPATINIFINNAGKSIHRSIIDSLQRPHDFIDTMALHYNAPVRISLSLIPGLIRVRGRIVNVSAINVLLPPVPFWAAYQSSKVAFDQWLRTAALDLKAAGICTSTIYLPLVKTRMISPNIAYRNLPAMHPEHVAAIICNNIMNAKKRYYPWWFPFAKAFTFMFQNVWQRIALSFVNKPI